MSGGGIYRKTWLHSAPPVHLETDGIFAHGHVTTADKSGDGDAGHAIVHRTHPSLGATAASAEVIASAEVVNTASSAAKATVQFALFDATGTQVGTTVASPVSLTAAPNVSSPTTAITSPVKIPVASPELWSVARPYLYTLKVSMDSGDAQNVSIGIYETKWTGDMGFFLNEEHVKIRGFCNHESFGGVGMAIPDRVNLFRAQGLRSVGGNGDRRSLEF
jgi:beta-galactosidase/beta-glucuronidase